MERITSKEIFKIVSSRLNFDIAKKSRQRQYIYGRGIANKLSKELTCEGLQMISKNYSNDHATVLHSVNQFETNYSKYIDPFKVLNVYNELYLIIQNKFNILNDDEILLFNSNVRIDNLESKIALLEFEIQSYEMNNVVLKNEYLRRLMLMVQNLEDSDIKELLEYRIKPFVNSLKTRKIQRIIPVVAGAKLNR
jgi:hypothetical protein